MRWYLSTERPSSGSRRDGHAGHVPAQRPPAQRPPAQRPPAQRPPAQRPPAQRPPAQRPPAQRRVLRHASATALAAIAPLLVYPSRALADAGGAEAKSQSLAGVLMAILIVGTAYLLAHFVVDRLQRRFLVLAGAEYLLLGGLLGPSVPQIPAFEDLTGIMPFVALAAGWVGLLRGMSFRLRDLSTYPPFTTRVVLLHHLLPGFVVGLCAYAVFDSGAVGRLSSDAAAVSAAVLGCCAAADSPAPFQLLVRRYRIDGELNPTLRGAAHLGDILVIFAFGVVFGVFHRDVPGAQLELTPTEWSVVSIGLGALLGALFRPFLAGNESENARFLALVGIISFASGAAYFLRLSPLLVNLVLGVVLVNTARAARAIHRTVDGTGRPMSIVLLVLAGALWKPADPWLTFYGVLGFAILRYLGKILGSKVAAFGTSMRSDLYRGLLAHGEVTVAMAVSFQVFYDGPAVDLAYSVILVSVIVHDLIAPRMLRSLLVDAGELKGEKPVSEPGAEMETS